MQTVRHEPPISEDHAGQIVRRRDWKRTLWLIFAPIAGRLSLAIGVAGAAMWAFLKIAHEVAEGETRHFDVMVSAWFQAHQSLLWHETMTALSWLAGPLWVPVVVLGTAAFFAWKGRLWPDGVTMLLATAGGQALVAGLKMLFQRPRPLEEFAHTTLPGGHILPSYSFPSSHSFMALTLYGLLAYWLTRDAAPRRRLGLWGAASALIVLVGLSRVFLGAHYPSDVAAGFAVALPWLWGCLALPGAFHKKGRDLSPEESAAHFETAQARLKEAALLLPNLIKLTARLARDSRVPRSRKVGLALLALYLAMPFDLIPDFIPVLGVADDIILVSLTLNWVLKAVPPAVVREHWDGEGDLLALLDQVRSAIRGLMKRN